MPTYAVCSSCFNPVRENRLQGRVEWVCSRCKKKAGVSDEFRVEIRPKRRLSRWLLWIGASLFIVLAGAAVAAKVLVK
jgi:hypothetical protein